MNMEPNQRIAETGLAVADMNLQETARVVPDEEERDEIFHDSMTEEQWRQQLVAPILGTELALQYREQTGEGIEEGGTGQYTLTHTDHEKSKRPQSSQDAEDRSGRRVR